MIQIMSAVVMIIQPMKDFLTPEDSICKNFVRIEGLHIKLTFLDGWVSMRS